MSKENSVAPDTEYPGAPPKPDQWAELVLVTPASAEDELREHNNMNRNISMAEVDGLVAVIEKDNWMNNGQTVTYDTDNEIVDGQHRFAAIGKSGKPQWIWVIHGLEPAVRPSVDDHRKRTFRDDLSMNNVGGGTIIEQVLRKVLQWEKAGGLARKGIRSNRDRVLRTTLTDAYRVHVDEINAAIDATRSMKRIPLSAGNRAFVWWLLRQNAPAEIVGQFFSILAIGSLEKDDLVVVALRDKLIRDRYAKDPNNFAVTTTPDHIYFTIRAWNAWLSKEELTTFNRPPGGVTNPFPIPMAVEIRRDWA